MSFQLHFGAGHVRSEDNPRVFLDISVNGEPAGRLVIELYADVVPKTAENFRALCTGEKGKSETTGRPLHYKGTVFYSIRTGFLALGGDISEKQDGEGGESIYGKYFEDENYQLSHDQPGLLSMATTYSNTNGSRFCITFTPVRILDRFQVVFGKVIKGFDTLYSIHEMGTPRGDPSGVVKITDCGQIHEDKGKKKIFLATTNTSDERLKKHSDKRDKPISDCGETSEDKKNNLRESDSDQGKNNKSLKAASSSDEQIKDSSDGEKHRKYSSSEGPLQIMTDSNEVPEDKKNNLMESDQDRGNDRYTELRQKMDWMMASIRLIAKHCNIPLPDYPLPQTQ